MKLTSNIETWNTLKALREEGGGGDELKTGDQRTYIY